MPFRGCFMIPLASTTSGGFSWSKLSRNEGYEVRRNGTVVGTLRPRSFFSSNYEAKTLEGTFTLRRTGCWGTKAEIFDTASQQRIAFFESGWRRSSTLTFADGRRFHIDQRGCWRPQWIVTAQSGQPVLSLHVRKTSVEAPVGTDIADSRLSLLIMFVLYRMRQAEEDASIGAIVAAVAASSS
jgi:hypothetical protein